MDEVRPSSARAAGTAVRRAGAVLALLAALTSPALANGPEIGHDAGMIFPLESTAVHLVAESVEVRFDWDAHRGSADCLPALR